MKHQSGFTLIEVLVAIFLISLIVVTLLRSQVQLAQANSNADLQITQAAVAEAASTRYSTQLSKAGFSIEGSPGTDFGDILNELNPRQQEILNQLSYSASNAGGQVTIKVWIKNQPADPRQLELSVTP